MSPIPVAVTVSKHAAPVILLTVSKRPDRSPVTYGARFDVARKEPEKVSKYQFMNPKFGNFYQAQVCGATAIPPPSERVTSNKFKMRVRKVGGACTKTLRWQTA